MEDNPRAPLFLSLFPPRFSREISPGEIKERVNKEDDTKCTTEEKKAPSEGSARFS